MDSAMIGVGGSSHDGTQNSGNRQRSYTRLSSSNSFIEYHHPAQRRELAADQVGLDQKQARLWFQIKRTQLKTQYARADNSALRIENGRIQKENSTNEALKKIICAFYGSPSFPREEHELFMQKMRLENAQLRDECEKVYKFLQSLIESQVSQQELQHGLIPIIGSSHDPTLASLQNQEAYGSGIGRSSLGLTSIIDGGGASFQNNSMEESLGFQNQKLLMKEIAATAREELARLMRYNEPFWILSSSQEGKLTLHLGNYEAFFPKNNHLIGPNVRVESSKDSVIVNIASMQLVEMFLDPVKWANLFPTIIAKAETIKVFDSGLSSNRNGALLLMCEEMHVLSPLVQSRKFHFLRYCENVEAGLWMITDVSVNLPGQHNPLSRSWKHPSGCMIQEMFDGSCRVVCVEHVEVDEIQTHQLFKNLVDSEIAYGAERWLKEMQRMCERFACFFDEKIPDHDPRGGYHVIHSAEGKRSMMNLSYRMVKMFCESLSMSGHDLNFPHPIMDNTSGVKISVRKNTEMGHLNGAVVVAATTLWFPLHYQRVFEFLTDTTKRPQWDVFAAKKPEHEIAHISVGANPGNYISLILPFMPNTENNMVTLQECSMDPIGSYVVYAPVDVAVMDMAIGGGETSVIPILPSGFVISADGQTNAEISGGSLLTVAFQMLVGCSLTPEGTQIQDVESVADVKNLLDSTVQKIQNALICY